jgi:hypothetical protein
MMKNFSSETNESKTKLQIAVLFSLKKWKFEKPNKNGYSIKTNIFYG